MRFTVDYSDERDSLVFRYAQEGFDVEIPIEPAQAYALYGIANSADCAVVMTDLNFEVQLWNAPAGYYFGTGAEDAIGMSLFELVPEVELHVRGPVQREIVGGALSFLQFGTIELVLEGHPRVFGLHLTTVEEHLRDVRTPLAQQIRMGARRRTNANTRLLFVFTPISMMEPKFHSSELGELFSLREVDRLVLQIVRSANDIEAVRHFAELLHKISNMDHVSVLLYGEEEDNFSYTYYEDIPEGALDGVTVMRDEIPNYEFLFAQQSLALPHVRYYSQRHLRHGRTISRVEHRSLAAKHGITVYQDLFFPPNVDSVLLLPIVYDEEILGLVALSAQKSTHRMLLDLEIDDRVISASKRLRVLSIFLIQFASTLINLRLFRRREEVERQAFGPAAAAPKRTGYAA